jgi:hypothetical protein
MQYLTTRQLAVAECLGRGLRNKEVASELGLTEGTVKVYISYIFTKLQIDSRLKLGLLFNGGELGVWPASEPKPKRAYATRAQVAITANETGALRPLRLTVRGPLTEVDKKWDRIFDEKFADPAYYVQPPEVSIGSTLGRS